jgi:hypothetical protein
MAGWLPCAAVPVIIWVAPPPVTVTEQPLTFDAFHPSGTLPMKVTHTACVSGPTVALGAKPPLGVEPQGALATSATTRAPAAQPVGVPDDVVAVLLLVVVTVAPVELVAVVPVPLLVDATLLRLEVDDAPVPVPRLLDVVDPTTVGALLVLDDGPPVYVPVLPPGVLVALAETVLLLPGVITAAAVSFGESPGSAAHAKNWMTGRTKAACLTHRRRRIGGPFSFGGRGRDCACGVSAYKLYRGIFAAHVPWRVTFR